MKAVLVVLVVVGGGCLITAGALLAPWAGFAVAGVLGVGGGLLIDDGSGNAPD